MENRAQSTIWKTGEWINGQPRIIEFQMVSVGVGENWKCGYCGHAQVIATERRSTHLQSLGGEGWIEGDGGYYLESIICANADCRKMSLMLLLLIRGRYRPQSAEFEIKRIVESWDLLPSSFAKPQPDYIPAVLRRDYKEACAIRDLSPKAAATIIRRCIQGIIRDFCGITKNRPIDEIRELRRRVDAGQAPPGVQAGYC